MVTCFSVVASVSVFMGTISSDWPKIASFSASVRILLFALMVFKSSVVGVMSSNILKIFDVPKSVRFNEFNHFKFFDVLNC